jgi:hypothetical protein
VANAVGLLVAVELAIAVAVGVLVEVAVAVAVAGTGTVACTSGEASLNAPCPSAARTMA